jgi:ABC-type transport system involved in multi-copper enzyme maturation permease subunit
VSRVLPLIGLTFRELAGQRVYRIVLAALLLVPWLLLIPASLFLLDVGKVLIDLLFTALHAWLLVYLFFQAAPLIARDIEQGSCHIFLTLPMRRSHYLWARFAGMIVALLPLLAAYGLSASLTLAFAESRWQAIYVAPDVVSLFLGGAALIVLPYLALTAVLFLIASWATGLPETMVFLFSVWLLCWSLPPVLGALQQKEVAAKTPPWIDTMLQTVNQVLPDLSSSRISLYLAHGRALDAVAVAGYCLQHLAYALLAMILAIFVFKRRDLV